MLIVKLQGGLGNQMFQYAAALGTAEKEDVYLDLNYLNKNNTSTETFTARSFELSVFPNIKHKHISAFLSNVLNRRNPLYLFLKRTLFRNMHFVHAETDRNEFGKYQNKYFDGYFQDEKYFKHIREQILKQYQFPVLSGDAKKLALQIEGVQSPVSVHVRRGDYMKPAINSYHGVLPVTYYQQAVDIITKQIAKPQYFVFSDDPEWCRANLTFLDHPIYLSGKNRHAWEEMCLMRLCHHHIIANSSFSWWAAWLNNNVNKIIVAPQKWFVNTKSDIIPKEWIQI